MDTLDRSAEPVEEKSVSPATLFRRAGGAASALVGLVREHQQAFLTVLSFLLIAAGWAAERWGSPAWAILLYAGGFVAGGYHSAREGLTTLIRERDLDVDLLMVVAAIGAASIGYWADGAVLILIFAFSGTLEEYAMRRTGRDIAALMTLSPETATVFKDGREVEVPVQEIRPGDLVLVRASERVPVDGVVVEGHSAVDEASITGESIPKEKSPGARVFAGTINGPGVLKVQAASSAEETLLARLIQLVQEAQQEKPRTQLFIERFERRYARFVVAASLLVGTLPPLVLGWSWSETVYRAMIFLVVASPCALVASMMPAVLSGISNGARHGILFKGGSHLEIMGELDVVAFDKTGTLTHGRPVVTDVVALDGGAGARQRVLQIAGSLERWSEHPLAAAVVAAAEAERVPLLEPEELQETPGAGLAGKVAGAPCLVGSVDFAARSGIELPGQLRQAVEELEREGKALAVVACAGRALGVLAFQDTLREQAPRVIRRLKEMGVRKVIMLTGDTQRSGEAIGAKAGCDQVYASLLPEDKVRIVKELSASHRRVAMVGDGVNDAPALASASVGIAMGGAGSDVALETADVVLVSDDLEKLPYAIALARRVRRIVKQNIVFSLSVMALLVTANFMEAISLPVGVIGHEGSTVLVILNGLRALCTPRAAGERAPSEQAA
ncbi:MAG: cadmium-translocating P-type ATPase [Firmicutes bacterium]|nr:cadmium-translocating P-type ATPase [Bacillota bacterium]